MKPRYFVLTDISDEEPDDKQSLVRLLLYSCDIEIEGLVATLSQWKAVHASEFRPEYIEQIVDTYGQIEDNLRQHRPDYPTASHLRALIATGNGNDMAAVGDDLATEGSELLCRSILRDDTRPLWVGIWGGASTLAQALWTLRTRIPAEELGRHLAKLWVFDIQGQDDAGAWVAVNFPELNYLRCQYAWRGMSYHIKHEWFETRGDFEAYVSPDWARLNLQEGHGPLGAAYPTAVYIHEGDTPSILHLVPNGLHDPIQIDQGGWGGRYDVTKRLNVWSGGCPVTDESKYGDFSMFSDAVDRCAWRHWDNRPTCNPYNTIIRWRNAYQNDFAARMDWCTMSPEEANHPPRAVVNGDASLDVLEIEARPGEKVPLDASGSSDPDGDALTYQWWIYRDAGTYRGEASIENAGEPIASFDVPDDAAGKTIHIILTLTDSGDPPLSAYRRVIVRCDQAAG